MQNVIVEGYIFEIDRSVPKVVDYVGKADGVVITAVLSGNDGWVKESEGTACISGTIKTYSGGTITNVSARNGEIEITDFNIDEEGKYTIDNITNSTTIVINAQDSNRKSNEKQIQVQVRVDNIVPIIESIDAKTEGMKILFTANGTDNESGLKQFNYIISSTEDITLAGIPEKQRAGTFEKGKLVEIIATAEKKYTISIKAIDNCDNMSEEKIVEVKTIDALTIAQAKELVNASNFKNYIGTRIIDYTPTAGGTWRIFYCEDSSNYFGDGEGTIYLKRDHGGSYSGTGHGSHKSSDNAELMKQMNPMWRDSANSQSIDNNSEGAALWLCDPAEWSDYKSEQAKYAIGGSSIEMLMKSYNAWKGNNVLSCKIVNGFGYQTYPRDNCGYVAGTDTWSVASGPHNIYVPSGDVSTLLCSPSCAEASGVYSQLLTTWRGLGTG